MGKSESGPDMLDCSLLAVELQRDLECSISLLLEPVGLVAGAGWRVGVVATSRKLTDAGPAWTAAVTQTWPHRNWRSLEALIFNLIHELDKRHMQQNLIAGVDPA